jgi:hypothetical protein
MLIAGDDMEHLPRPNLYLYWLCDCVQLIDGEKREPELRYVQCIDFIFL